ncbi:MAG: precorrin-3B C(17)-methyltransferase, partial [Alphaproteobacteria bacterium]|nr:precorrin-3B C(17)-methyltransferase [Alphaproteobacteria bacterium]
CSGDPGIYALATLVFELLADTEDRALKAVDVEVVPGISAFQLAAARLGAPMGHDFCLISLSDLLTPVAAIRQRLAAAAQGDFVTAFYNPQSKRRRTLLPEAREVFLAQRPPTTPVALCRQLGRPEESIIVTTLQDFDPSIVDMFTLVVIGSSTTRSFDHAGIPRAFTPRGYADKRTN